MDSLKNAGQPPLKKLIRGTTEAHGAIHTTIRHHATNSAERRAAAHAKAETELRLNGALGKGGV